jgi:hypothetical protein
MISCVQTLRSFILENNCHVNFKSLTAPPRATFSKKITFAAWNLKNSLKLINSRGMTRLSFFITCASASLKESVNIFSACGNILCRTCAKRLVRKIQIFLSSKLLISCNIPFSRALASRSALCVARLTTPKISTSCPKRFKRRFSWKIKVFEEPFVEFQRKRGK